MSVNSIGTFTKRSVDVHPEKLNWIWPGYLLEGGVTLLAGEAGAGKTTIAIDLAARLTSSARWPDGSINKMKGAVLLYSSEDSFSKVNKQRAEAAGIDHSLLRVVSNKFNPITQIDDLLDELEQLVVTENIKLVILDPLVDFVKGDLNKANDVRNSLRKLVDFSDGFNIATLGITHFAKAKDGISLKDRILGSQAFSAYARVALLAASDKNGDNYLGFAKNNYHRTDKTIKYSIEPCEVTYESFDDKFITTFIKWGEVSEHLSLEEVLEGKTISKPQQKLREQVQALINFIGSEKRCSSEVEQWFISNHGSESTLKKVKKLADIQSKKIGDKWYCVLKHEMEGEE